MKIVAPYSFENENFKSGSFYKYKIRPLSKQSFLHEVTVGSLWSAAI